MTSVDAKNGPNLDTGYINPILYKLYSTDSQRKNNINDP